MIMHTFHDLVETPEREVRGCFSNEVNFQLNQKEENNEHKDCLPGGGIPKDETVR